MRRLLALAPLVALSLAALPAQAQKIEATALGTFFMQNGTNRVDADVAFDFSNGGGGGLLVGVNLGKLGVEAGAFFLRTSGSIQFQGSTGVGLDKVDLIPLMLVARFHPLSEGSFDPWVGAGGAYVIGQNLHSADLDAAGFGVIDVESKAAFVLNAGVGFKIAKNVTAVVDGRYMPLKLDTTPMAGGTTFELKMDPLLVSAGVRLSF